LTRTIHPIVARTWQTGFPPENYFPAKAIRHRFLEARKERRLSPNSERPLIPRCPYIQRTGFCKILRIGLAIWLLACWVFNDPLARDANASSNYKGNCKIPIRAGG